MTEFSPLNVETKLEQGTMDIQVIPRKTAKYGLRYILAASITLVTIAIAVTISLVLNPNSFVDGVVEPSETGTGITVHILDNSIGLPAAGVTVQLDYYNSQSSTWNQVTSSTTNADGRCDPFWPTDSVEVY
jgi:hypothetical protein